MKKILMLLVFITLSVMGAESYEIEKNFSSQERFEMLFGKTTLHFYEVRQSRKSRNSRTNRKIELTKVVRATKMIELANLTQEEKFKMLFGKTKLTQRVARRTRFRFLREARQNLYIALYL